MLLSYGSFVADKSGIIFKLMFLYVMCFFSSGCLEEFSLYFGFQQFDCDVPR